MNNKILLGVSVSVMILNSINVQAGELSIYESNSSTPFVSLNSAKASLVINHNQQVYQNNSTVGATQNLSTNMVVGGSNPSNAAVILGEGMDPDRNSMRGQCMDGTEITPLSTTNADISIDGSYTRYSFLKDFAASASGGGSWGAFSGSASGSYARLTKEDRMSLVYLYKSSYNLGSKSLTNYSVKPEHKALSLQKFRNQCGDRFLKEVKLGGSLFYTVKLSFDNYFDRLTVKASAKASFMSFSGSGSFNRTTQTISNRGSIKISVNQSGGDVALLGKALSSATGSGTTASITCDFSDMTKCMLFVDSLAEYAANSFPSQLQQNRESNVISTHYLDYGVAGIPALPYPSGITPDFFSDIVWGHRLDLAGLLEENAVRSNTVDRLTKHFESITTPTQQDTVNLMMLSDISIILQAREKLVEPNTNSCWTMPVTCDNKIIIMNRVLNHPLLGAGYKLFPEHLALLATKI